MFGSLTEFLKTLALLRHPEVRSALGELRFRRQLVDAVRTRHVGAKVADTVHLVGYEPARLALDPGSSVGLGTILAFGDETSGFGRITVGAGTWIGEYNNLRACGGGDIVVGAHCLISQFCTLIASNHAKARGRLVVEQGADLRRLGITLRDDVWLGAGVTVLPGVCLGQGCVIGANSVVNCSVPDYEIWAGSPAQRVGARE